MSPRRNGFSFKISFTQNVIHLLLILLVNTNITRQHVIEVKRRSSSGDLFEIQPDKGTLSICGKASVNKLCIEKYNAFTGQEGLGTCICECSGLFSPTFYGKQLKCVSNQVVVDDNQCSLQVKEGASFTSMSSLDTNVSTIRQLPLKNDLPKNCPRVTATWYYFQHNEWKTGTPNIFTVVSKQVKNSITDLFGGNNLINSTKTWVLQISGGLPEEYKGLLIKVKLQCVMDHGFNPESKCVMFKTLGTHKVLPPPPTTTQPSTSTPSTTEMTSTITTILSSTTKKELTQKLSTTDAVMSTATSSTTTSNPNKETYTSENGRIWIIFVAGGVTFLVVMALGGVLTFLLVHRNKKKKQHKENIALACTRPNDVNTMNSNPISPPHDYEYVVYPALSENYQPSTTLVNASYGRGPDNELIIRTPGVSTDSLKSRLTNSSTKSSNSLSSTIPKHDYNHLQDQNDANQSIYQPLIRTLKPEAITPKPEGENTDEGQREYMELIHVDENTPEYIVLDPVNSEDDEGQVDEVA